MKKLILFGEIVLINLAFHVTPEKIVNGVKSHDLSGQLR